MPSDLKKSITKEEVNELPLKYYKGDIVVIKDDTALKYAIEMLQKEKVLGFDTETKPLFKKGASHLPSLLQLATQDAVYLFQLQLMENIESLAVILEAPDIIKTGVAIDDDVKSLQKLFPFNSAGFVEIGDMALKLGFANTELRNLVALLFRFRISKNLQLSNWANEDLTSKQINYAATDAWASRNVYLTLQKLLKST